MDTFLLLISVVSTFLFVAQSIRLFNLKVQFKRKREADARRLENALTHIKRHEVKLAKKIKARS